MLWTCAGDGDGLAAVARATDVHGSDVDDVVLPGLQLQQTLAGRDRHDAPAGDTDASLPSFQTDDQNQPTNPAPSASVRRLALIWRLVGLALLLFCEIITTVIVL